MAGALIMIRSSECARPASRVRFASLRLPLTPAFDRKVSCSSTGDATTLDVNTWNRAFRAGVQAFARIRRRVAQRWRRRSNP